MVTSIVWRDAVLLLIRRISGRFHHSFLQQTIKLRGARPPRANDSRTDIGPARLTSPAPIITTLSAIRNPTTMGFTTVMARRSLCKLMGFAAL